MKLALEWQEEELFETGVTPQLFTETIVPSRGSAATPDDCNRILEVSESVKGNPFDGVTECVAGNPFDDVTACVAGNPFDGDVAFQSDATPLPFARPRSGSVSTCASTPTQYSDTPSGNTSEMSARTSESAASPPSGSRRRNFSAPLRRQGPERQPQPIGQSPGSSIRSLSP